MDNKKSLIKILIAGATLLPLNLYSQKEINLPKEIRGIKLSEGEKSYFEQLQSTPELLKEKRKMFVQYEDYSGAIDYTKKAMAFAYEKRDKNLYSKLEVELVELTSEYNFIKSMNFGIFSNEDGRIAVYNYLNSKLEDSTRAKSFGLIKGRKKLAASKKQNISKSKKYQFENEEVKVIGYGEKTLYLYFSRIKPKKITEEILKSLSPIPEDNPFKKK